MFQQHNSASVSFLPRLMVRNHSGPVKKGAGSPVEKGRKYPAGWKRPDLRHHSKDYSPLRARYRRTMPWSIGPQSEVQLSTTRSPLDKHVRKRRPEHPVCHQTSTTSTITATSTTVNNSNHHPNLIDLSKFVGSEWRAKRKVDSMKLWREHRKRNRNRTEKAKTRLSISTNPITLLKKDLKHTKQSEHWDKIKTKDVYIFLYFCTQAWKYHGKRRGKCLRTPSLDALALSIGKLGSFSRSSSVVAVILRSAGVAHLGLSEPVCERRDA